MNYGAYVVLSRLGKEAPEQNAGKKIYWVVRDFISDLKDHCKHKIKNDKHHQGPEKRPKVSQHGVLVFQYEISTYQLFKDDY